MKKAKIYNEQSPPRVLVVVGVFVVFAFGNYLSASVLRASSINSQEKNVQKHSLRKDKKTSEDKTDGLDKNDSNNTESQVVSDTEETKTSKTNSKNSVQNQTQTATNTTSTTARQPAMLTVKLRINGSYKGSLNLSSGSNQCQVLSKALASGIIASLDMRYYAQYGSQAVYMIDGVGDSNSVWWTYTVNGRSPPLGCSQVQVGNNDDVNWQYIK